MFVVVDGSVAARGGGNNILPYLAFLGNGFTLKEGYTVQLIDAIAQKWDEQDVVNDIQQSQSEIIEVDTNFSSL